MTAATCGYRTGQHYDSTRANWSNDGPRPLIWSAWYPTYPETRAAPVRGQAGLFDLGKVGVEAPFAASGAVPVVLLSHGTGGTAESLGWLAGALAHQGWVVLGANHHGNTGLEPYRAEGFLCWWERAKDLSVLLRELQRNGPFAGRLDLKRVVAVGFSLGAHTALCLAGARCDVARFERWAKDQGSDGRGPREFPHAPAALPHLLHTSQAFKRSWQAQSDLYRDPLVGAVYGLAPPPPVQGFDLRNLAALSLPVRLVASEGDREAPFQIGAKWLQEQNPQFELRLFGKDVGHYAYLGLPADPRQKDQLELFVDPPCFDRQAFHREIIKDLSIFLGGVDTF